MTAARRLQLLTDALVAPTALPGQPGPSDLLIERVDEIGSTSTDLLNRRTLVDAAEADPDGAAGLRPGRIGAVWLIADHQTGGRGRRGRQWHSDPRASLAASLAIEAALPADPGALTLVAGAAVARTLQAFGARPWLKWPNDVYLRDAGGGWAKAGGILCESRILAQASPGAGPASAAARPTWRLVVGCGLNLFPASHPLARPADAAHPQPDTVVAGPPPGHLFGHADPELRDRLEQALGLALALAIHAALRAGPAAGLASWGEFDLLAGQAVTIHGADGVHQAIARGIDASGRLLVCDPAEPQRCRALVAEEVSIRRLPD